MKDNQIEEDDTTTNLSLFCEKKEDLLALISNESKFNFACYMKCMCVCVRARARVCVTIIYILL